MAKILTNYLYRWKNKQTITAFSQMHILAASAFGQMQAPWLLNAKIGTVASSIHFV